MRPSTVSTARFGTACAVLLVAAGGPCAGSAHAEVVEAYAAADVADCTAVAAARSIAATTSRLIPAGALVLVAGDAIYERPTLANYRACYGPTWGVHLAHTLIVPGNHDYESGRADGFFEYFGAAAGDHGHFARRVGDWLVIGLDSNLGGDARERQLAWLASTLRDRGSARCTFALWHTPLFSSGPHRGGGDAMRAYWALLDAFGADLVLNGHEHNYEAFDPRDAQGRSKEGGMREFVVGTGGAPLYGFWRPTYASRARLESHGVLHLTLSEGEYAWEFLDIDGHAHDVGRATCRRPPPVSGR